MDAVRAAPKAAPRPAASTFELPLDEVRHGDELAVQEQAISGQCDRLERGDGVLLPVCDLEVDPVRRTAAGDEEVACQDLACPSRARR